MRWASRVSTTPQAWEEHRHEGIVHTHEHYHVTHNYNDLTTGFDHLTSSHAHEHDHREPRTPTTRTSILRQTVARLTSMTTRRP